MKIDIITLFPDMFKGPFAESIIKRAKDKSLVEIDIHNLRKWAKDKRGTVDDRPYGGGVGMVLMIQPLFDALESLNVKCQMPNAKSISNDKSFDKLRTGFQNSKVILLSPRGKVWKQKLVQEYSKLEHLILICGHYEGVDERVKKFIDEEISIGDYVLTGGELPAMVIVDSIVRLIPGVLEKPESVQFESFSLLTSLPAEASAKVGHPHPQLEYPQYTHPEDFKGLKVPPILLSGNHAEIARWRTEKSLEITKKSRPDLLK